MPNDLTARNILDMLSDLENYPEESLAPYEEFEVDGKVYYFTPGGFLYRKDPGTDEVGGFFCGYLSDEVWHYRTSQRLVEMELARRGQEGKAVGLSPFVAA